MNGAIAIFVKTPGYSPIKTRLASECGARYAREWYQRSAAAVASVARAAQEAFGLAAYWAVAEDDALSAWPDLPTLAQGEGELGTRLARVHAQLVSRHQFGLSIGADAPQITAGLLGDAANWLAQPAPRFALGPARDGGFWLFGGNNAPAMAIWQKVRYSEVDTADDLQRHLADSGEWLQLPKLTDADHASDLPVVLADLRALRETTPEQSALATWMSQQNVGLA